MDNAKYTLLNSPVLLRTPYLTPKVLQKKFSEYGFVECKKVLVLTSNQYLKLGFETLLRKQVQSVNGQIIIFDAGERIYFLQQTGKPERNPTDFFSFLTKSISFNKKDVDTLERFLLILNEKINKVKNPYKKSSNELSKNELFVINALSKGWPMFEVADFLNKSIKTVSTQKNRALQKLGVRNMQVLHSTMVQWYILINESNSALIKAKYTTVFYKR
ncbi:TPA: response regulator transcription factor [Salmonella enterica]|nr:response regulator transcription factor [Salmonella enterica]HDC2349602.1 response regulator transcription factor [Salmonella enterica]